ncbi:ribonuclease P protein component [Rhodoflexus sp.]
MKTNGFPKRERLKSKKMIQELFAKGSFLFLYPFKIAYLPSEDSKADFPQVLVSVSRKNFRRAHDRNLVKRRCREIYRCFKTDLLAQKKQLPACLGIIYVGKKHEDFAFMQQRLREVLSRLPTQSLTPASAPESPAQNLP